MKSLLSVLSVTVLVAPPCALAGIVVRASEQARRGTSPSGRDALHCDRARKASCRSTRSARRHEGTEEVESWFTRTSVMDCLIPRPGMARSLSDAPRRGWCESFACRAVRRWGDVVRVEPSWRTDEAARKPTSKPFSVSPCLRALRVNQPEARSPVRFTVVRHVPGAGRRGRRPLPPILPRRGLVREGPAPPSARDVRTSRVRDATAGGTLLILR